MSSLSWIAVSPLSWSVVNLLQWPVISPLSRPMLSPLPWPAVSPPTTPVLRLLPWSMVSALPWPVVSPLSWTVLSPPPWTAVCPVPQYHPLPANTLSIYASLKSGYSAGRQVTSLLLVSPHHYGAGRLFVTARCDTLIIHVTVSGSPAANIIVFTLTSHLFIFTTVTL